MPDTPTPGQVFWQTLRQVQVFWQTLRQAWRTDPTFVVCAAVGVVGMSCIMAVAALALLLRIVERWKGCV